MGTRHYQTVITKEGDIVIKQYGQWDGYPSGQGVDILNYLKDSDLKKYQENLTKIKLVTEEENEIINSDKNWIDNYPYLSRDCGSKIHQMIEDGLVNFVNHMDLDEAEKWCEGFYTIDFQKNIFISEYRNNKVIFNLNNLPTEKEYLKMFNNID